MRIILLLSKPRSKMEKVVPYCLSVDGSRTALDYALSWKLYFRVDIVPRHPLSFTRRESVPGRGRRIEERALLASACAEQVLTAKSFTPFSQCSFVDCAGYIDWIRWQIMPREDYLLTGIHL